VTGNDASLFPTPRSASPVSSTHLSPHQLGILQSELHRALQAGAQPALDGFFDGGVVFGPQYGFLGSDNSVDGSFLIFGRGAAVQVGAGAGAGAGCDLQRQLPHR
jgi:hypothetical protein